MNRSQKGTFKRPFNKMSNFKFVSLVLFLVTQD